MSRDNSEKQRVWVVTESYNHEVVPKGRDLAQTAEGLADEFDVWVICGQRNYLSRVIEAPEREFRNRVKIHRVRSRLLDGNVRANRFLNAITFGVSMFWNTLRSFRKGDRVLVVSAPLYLPFVTAIASLVKGGAYTLLIKEYYPDHLVSLGKLKQDSMAVRAMHFANAWLFKHASRIMVVDSDVTELVSARTDGTGVPIKTLQYWAATDELRNHRTVAQTKYTSDVTLELFRDALR